MTTSALRLNSRPRWLVLLLAAVGSVAVLVWAARWAWAQPAVAAFVARYPGVSQGATAPGTPVWVAALHALNLFFGVQIVASGWRIRGARRPIGHWTRRGGRGKSGPITIEQWFHVGLDLLWVVTGGVFVALLFLSGRWVRLVPTNWDVLPNAASVGLQYLSLHWPAEDSWLAYNALQQLTYFAVVFVMAPLAAFTGFRISALWPARLGALAWPGKERARRVHFVVMVLFLGFVVIHVGLVIGSGPVRTLNHMFAAEDTDSLVGVAVLAGVLTLAAAAVAAARPIVLQTLAGLTGRVTH